MKVYKIVCLSLTLWSFGETFQIGVYADDVPMQNQTSPDQNNSSKQNTSNSNGSTQSISNQNTADQTSQEKLAELAEKKEKLAETEQRIKEATELVELAVDSRDNNISGAKKAIRAIKILEEDKAMMHKLEGVDQNLEKQLRNSKSQ